MRIKLKVSFWYAVGVEESMQKNEYPSFHKKNIIKRSEKCDSVEASVSDPVDISENQVDIPEDSSESFDYPRFSLSTNYDDEQYSELYSAVEFYNHCKFDIALEQFEKRPSDPARAMKNMICTFYGPIGWLLMYNTKNKKDKYVNFCIACCKYRLGRYSEALEHIRYDDRVNFVYLKAWCCHKLNQHDESKKFFKEVFKIRPEYMFKYKFPYSERDVL